jgi:phosphate transport system substrate-binding protein
MKKIAVLAFVVILALASCVFAEEMLNGAGATFPYPLYSAWTSDYYKVTGIKVNYQPIGSGGGIRQITERSVDFAASDKPLKPEELARENLIQFPTVIGGVVPVVNIPGIKTGELKLDSEAVCRIYLGEIKNWNDEAIKKLNPTASLPDSEIIVVHRSDWSGTTAMFTYYLSGVCPAWEKRVGYETSVNWPTGIGANGNGGVANYVKKNVNTIGYVEFAYARQTELNHTMLKNKAGQFVEPNFESFEDAAAVSNFDPSKHFYLWLTNATGKKSWPIVGATFILLAKEKRDRNVKVARFFDWAFKNGDNKARELIYVPLPQSLKGKIDSYWKSNGIQ